MISAKGQLSMRFTILPGTITETQRLIDRSDEAVISLTFGINVIQANVEPP